MDGKMDRRIGGQANEWMDMQYTCIEIQKNDDLSIDFVSFTKALQTDQQTNRPTYGPTNGPTNGLTNGHTLSYRCDSRI